MYKRVTSASRGTEKPASSQDMYMLLQTREREEAVTKIVMWDLQTQRGNKQAYITNAIIINIYVKQSQFVRHSP